MRPIESRLYDSNGSTRLAISQTSYDSLGRTQCIAQRMNPAVFNSLPSSACMPGTPGANGADRISKTVFDAAGQVTRAIAAYGASLVQDAVTTTYTAKGVPPMRQKNSVQTRR